MNVLLVSAYFPPEIGSASHLFYEVGGEFVRRGHRVTVLTCYPTYNVDPAALPEQYRSGLSMTEEMNGMTVVRMRNLGLPRNISTLRGIGQITMALTLAYAGLFRVRADPRRLGLGVEGGQARNWPSNHGSAVHCQRRHHPH